MRKYCAFWYPTIYHLPIENRRRYYSLPEFEISDHVQESSSRRYLLVEEDKKSGNLIFNTYSKNEDGGRNQIGEIVELKLEKKSGNGFVVYSYDESKIDFSEHLYKCVCYHRAKSLYHDHEINHEADSGLEAMSECDGKIVPSDLTKADNPILQFYLKQYEQLFSQRYVVQLSDLNAKYERLLVYINQLEKLKKNDISGIVRKKSPEERKRFEKALRRLEINAKNNDGPIMQGDDTINHSVHYYKKSILSFLDNADILLSSFLSEISELCGNAMMEYAYCKTLLDSKYNTETRHTVAFSPEELGMLEGSIECDGEKMDSLRHRDEQRKIAINIRNSMRYIDCIKYKCANGVNFGVSHQFSKAEQLSKVSKVIAIISLIVSLIGAISIFFR